MILYRPTDGEIHTTPIRLRPRCAFIMSQLGGPVPEIVLDVRRSLLRLLSEHSYSAIDADSLTTGKDFLLKIWQIVLSDYLRRAYLLTGEESLRRRAQEVYAAAGVGERAKTSVETLLTSF